MSRFRRPQAVAIETPLAAGTAPCDANGCANHTAVQCGYRDRRGRACTAAFCPDHYLTVREAVYCRRHANTVTALGERGMDSNALPDLDDRAASLVNWISNELDDTIHGELRAAARPGETVVADRRVTRARDGSRRGRWERCWKLVESTGVVIKVTIHVGDEDRSLVYVRVDTEVVADTPPWIENRREGHEMTASMDQSQRRIFYGFLEEHIAAAVNRACSRGDRPYWQAA